jgi:dolichol-phosphate mannosyltransferase
MMIPRAISAAIRRSHSFGTQKMRKNTMLGRIPPVKSLQTVSVLVPTYMEKNNITVLIKSINENLSGYTFEVVIIDDNSSDGTANEVRLLTKDYAKTKLIVRSGKMGLGSAYRDGFSASSYEYIVEMDADMSHNPQEIIKLLQSLNQNDIVIGSRYIPGGNIVGWNWRRKLISWGANCFVRAVFRLKQKDVTSGFRVYSKGAFERIITQSKLNGYGFQIEVLYLAAKFGFKVKEVPITFNERKEGKSKLGTKEILSFAKAMFSLRFRRVKVD